MWLARVEEDLAGGLQLLLQCDVDDYDQLSARVSQFQRNNAAVDTPLGQREAVRRAAALVNDMQAALARQHGRRFTTHD